jgi:tetratricopeptide (TPR) repeat protein
MPIRVKARRPAIAPALRSAAGSVFGLPIPPADWPQRPAGISLCMIVKNEERFLEQCLRSVADVVDEINIVDTGSTDRTIEIAETFGARIERREWRNDFAWARNESLKMATKRWIFQLDADEELLPESKPALLQLKNAPAYNMGIWLRCINASDKYRGGGNVSHAIVRLFPNHERIRLHGTIHEFPSWDDSPVGLPGVTAPIKIIHHGYLTDVVNERDKYARNMAIIEASIQTDPEEAFHWYNVGMTAHLGGNHDRGIEGFEQMWELCKKHGMRAFTPNGLQTLADIYTEHKQQPEKGLAYALECIKLSPRYANGHFAAGKAYVALNRLEEAREMYAAAIADGEHLAKQYVVDDEVPAWKAQCEIGGTYVTQGDYATALEWFDRGLANRPTVQPLRINRASALERLGRLGEAERDFCSIYEDFRDEQSVLQYGNFLLRHKKEREALALIEREHANCSDQVAGPMLLAAAAISQRNGWNDGEQYLLAAQARQPDSAEIRHALSTLHANRGRAGEFLKQAHEALARKAFEDALQAARSGLAIAATHEGLAYYAAIACANLGRKEEGAGYLEALERSGHTLSETACMLKAALLRELQRPQEALAAVERAVTLNPNNADARLLKAGLLEALGRVGDAEAVLRDLMPVAKQRASVELGAMYLRLGRLAEAKRIAEEALA